MLEGLEITIYNKNQILIDNDEFRIDSEYYKKEYLELYDFISGSPSLGNLTYMSDLSSNGSFATVASIKNDNNPKVIPFIRSGNVGDTFINESDLEFISKEAHLNLPKSTTELHEIMMARKGKIGGASIITEEEVDFNCSENVIKLRVLEKDKLNPFYFTSYFNSKFGIKQVERLSTGNVQPWVSIFQIKKLMIPFLDINFQSEIERLIVQSHQHNLTSKSTFEDAKDTLLKRIGLQNFESKQTDNYQEISLSKSFSSTTRLDAEYYHPKPLFLINQLKQKEYHLVKHLFDIGNGYAWKSKYFKESGEGEPFVRIRNCKPGYIDNETLTTLDSEYANSEGVKKAKENDIVIGMDGIKYFYGSLIKEPVYVNQRVCHLRPKEGSEVDSELVLMIINSVIGQTQLMREMTIAQTVGHITNASVGNLIIPKLDEDVRNEISSKIKESHKLEKESLHLLEVAKRAVEIAIEENEEKALEFIKREIKE
jgi:restriction endonuclease S subunit